jgi:hypothetical protein
MNRAGSVRHGANRSTIYLDFKAIEPAVGGSGYLLELPAPPAGGFTVTESSLKYTSLRKGLKLAATKFSILG